MRKSTVKATDLVQRKRFWRITMNNAYFMTAIPPYSPTSHEGYRKAVIFRLLILLSVEKHKATLFVNRLSQGTVRKAFTLAYEKFHEEAAQAYGDNKCE